MRIPGASKSRSCMERPHLPRSATEAKLTSRPSVSTTTHELKLGEFAMSRGRVARAVTFTGCRRIAAEGYGVRASSK